MTSPTAAAGSAETLHDRVYREDETRREHAGSRRRLGPLLAWGYLLLLFSIVLMPVVLVLKQPDALKAADVRDLVLAASSSLSGLVGLLGFVIGYYFKSAPSGDA